jgi:hypothetical protein
MSNKKEKNNKKDKFVNLKVTPPKNSGTKALVWIVIISLLIAFLAPNLYK